MTRLLIVCLCLIVPGSVRTVCAADPMAAGSPLELVFIGEEKLARAQVRVEVNGKPISAIWDETFARLHAFFDRNADQALDAAEAAHLPSAFALRQAMGNGFTPPIGSPPAFVKLDRDGDGKVTLAELAAFYRRAGLGNALIGVGRLPASAELTDALLKHLDADGDGKVTENEWKIAAESLKKIDKNDDELIGVGELVPKTVYPGAAGSLLLAPPGAERTTIEILAKLPLILLSSDEKDTNWATDLVRRRDRDGDGKLTKTEAGLDAEKFKLLDADRDGKLSADELADWRRHEPDVRWVVRLGDKAPKTDRLNFLQGKLRVDGWATSGKMTDFFASARRQLSTQFDNPTATDAGERPPQRRRQGNIAWLTAIADRNGDGKLDRKEIDDWFELQEQVTQGQVLLTVLDGDAGLFWILDANHDGALSLRELRAAGNRVREIECLTNGVFDRAKLPHDLSIAASQGYPQSFGISMRRGPAWFQSMDRNNDGDVSRLEFLGTEDDFKKLDANGDGLISVDEAKAAKPANAKMP